MKTTITKLPKSIIEAVVDFDKKEWADAQEVAVKKLAKEVTVKGFRKGKAPLETSRKYIATDKIFNEAINHLIQTNLAVVLKENNINPMIQPSVDVLKVTEDLLQVKYIFTVAPEVKLGQYKDLEIGKKEVKVSTKEVTEKLEELVKENTELSVKEGAAVLGDTVVIDFEGFVNNEVFDGGKAENFDLELGSGQFIPGFEDQLVGVKAGEDKEINVVFPENYIEALKGQKAMFKVKIHEVKSKKLPELNDEFAATINKPGATDLASLKKVVKEELTAQKETEEKTRYLNKLLAEIAKLSEIEISDSILQEEATNMKNNLVKQVEQQGLNLEQYLQLTNGNEKELDAQFARDAKANLDAYLVVNEVAKVEKVTISEEDVEAELVKMGAQYNMEPARVREILGESLNNLRTDLGQRKTIDLLISLNK